MPACRVVMALPVLDSLVLTGVTAAIFEAAGRLNTEVLNCHDAVHLAAALDLGDDLDSLVTYNDRLASGARSYGLAVAAPA